MNPRTHHQHEEILTAAGREYKCLFRREVDSGYRVTCAELPPVLAFARRSMKRAPMPARRSRHGLRRRK
jgi:hypothetical protein